MAALELDHVAVSRAGVALLADVSLHVADGELVAVVGASGSGKTSLLRAVAGLDPSTGRIAIGGVDVSGLPPSSRDVAMVFQESALFPNRSVRRNVSFPLEVRGRDEGEIHDRVLAEARALHIEALLERHPDELSVGELQLVQIARAMVRVPSVLLLDEPLAHLDAAVRQRMRLELRALQQGYGVTTLLTTNDPVEAMSMPDRLVVLRGGGVAQVGTPLDVYAEPVDLDAATCTGTMSTLRVDVRAADGEGVWLVNDAIRHRAWRPALRAHLGTTIRLGVRPEWVTIGAGPYVADVVAVRRLGGRVEVDCRIGGDVVEVHVDHVDRADVRAGDRVGVAIDRHLEFDAVGRRIA